MFYQDGKLLASGGANSNLILVRLLRNGHLDSTFGINGISEVHFGETEFSYDTEIQPDGKIVMAGFTTVFPRYYPNYYIALPLYAGWQRR